MVRYLIISNALLWALVIGFLVMKIRQLLKRRGRIRAVVLNDSGGVKDEYVLDRQKELLIGKSTPSNMVNIDFSDSRYARSIEEDHACLRRSGAFWYVEARADNGMVGLKQRGKDTVYKLRRDIPYRIGSGDIIYISYEKIVIE